MSLIESCKAVGVTLGSYPNLGEIIEALKEKSGDLKVKLFLGIALQEAGSDPEALKIFTECAEMGSVSGSARSHMMRPYLKCLYLRKMIL